MSCCCDKLLDKAGVSDLRGHFALFVGVLPIFNSIFELFDVISTVIAVLAKALRVVRLVSVCALVCLPFVAPVMVAGVAHELGPMLSRHVKTSAHVCKILKQLVEERVVLTLKIEAEVVVFVIERTKILESLGGY